MLKFWKLALFSPIFISETVTFTFFFIGNLSTEIKSHKTFIIFWEFQNLLNIKFFEKDKNIILPYLGLYNAQDFAQIL